MKKLEFTKISLPKFQSPRSGKFVSNLVISQVIQSIEDQGFNPLDQGNLYLMWHKNTLF